MLEWEEQKSSACCTRVCVYSFVNKIIKINLKQEENRLNILVVVVVVVFAKEPISHRLFHIFARSCSNFTQHIPITFKIGRWMIEDITNKERKPYTRTHSCQRNQHETCLIVLSKIFQSNTHTGKEINRRKIIKKRNEWRRLYVSNIE